MMCVIAKAARPEKHKVLPLCEGDKGGLHVV